VDEEGAQPGGYRVGEPWAAKKNKALEVNKSRRGKRGRRKKEKKEMEVPERIYTVKKPRSVPPVGVTNKGHAFGGEG